MKVTISLPADLLKSAEGLERRTGESRSEFIRRLLEERIQAAREREAVERYRRGYLEQPETAEEAAMARHTAKLATWEPWE